MLYQVKLRTTSPWLGQQKSPKGVRHFRRTPDNNILIDLPQWAWALREAADALHMDDVDIDTINFEAGMRPPTLVLYTRNYKFKGRPKQEMFEAIRDGVPISLDMLVTTSPPDKTHFSLRTPSSQELQEIIGFTGKMIGLSPFGSRFGYGRFELLELIEK